MRLFEILLFILPAYVANATPVVCGGGPPVDGGAHFVDGRRLLGDGKTWRGSIAGILAGVLTTLLISLYDPRFFFSGIVLSVGTIFGDIIGSFVKRRLGAAQGSKFELIDRLFFFIVAVPPASLFFPISIMEFIALLLLTFFIHPAANVFAYWLGLKKVPW